MNLIHYLSYSTEIRARLNAIAAILQNFIAPNSSNSLYTEFI